MARPGLRVVLRLEGDYADTVLTALEDNSGLSGFTALLDSTYSSLTSTGSEALQPEPEDEGSTPSYSFTPGPSDPPTAVRALASSLRAGSEDSKAARIREAYLLGTHDAEVVTRLLAGSIIYPDPVHCTRPAYFVHLFDRVGTGPFWTTSRDIYNQTAAPRGVPSTSAFGRLFTTQSEFRAYQAGLGASPPLPERQ